jgi:cytochrome c peroxidase
MRYVPILKRLGGALLLGALISSGSAFGAAEHEREKFLRPEAAPTPKGNEMTPARVELGKALFFDPRLSGSNWISCGTCHNPVLGWSDGLPTAIGHGMKVLGRATPTILNTAYQKFQFWDGRAKSLEEQALGPIEADVEMAGDLEVIIKKLAALPGYVAMFDKAYPVEGVNKDTIAKAISSFERSIVSTDAPFDRWIKGDKKAMNDAGTRGFDLFTGKANCVACHQAFNFTDDGFHNIGLKGNQDVGRFAKVPVKVLRGAMKTPTLRDIELTGPYMHNGMYKSLEEVVDHYNRGGDEKDTPDPNMKVLNLTDAEKKDLVAFLRSLTGSPREITFPRLPQ